MPTGRGDNELSACTKRRCVVCQLMWSYEQQKHSYRDKVSCSACHVTSETTTLRFGRIWRTSCLIAKSFCFVIKQIRLDSALCITADTINRRRSRAAKCCCDAEAGLGQSPSQRCSTTRLGRQGSCPHPSPPFR